MDLPTKTLLILGAKSSIGMALAHQYAQHGYNLQLAGRGISVLEADKADLMIRYNVSVSTHEFDIIKTESHQNFFDSLIPPPEGIFCVAGLLGNQNEAQVNFTLAKLIIDTNYSGPVSILEIIATAFSKRGHGFIGGITSVAGDRGRKSNYIYGSAKAGFATYLSGLRHRLHKHNIHVLTVKPGFVYTQMTEALLLPPSLTATPAQVAKDIFHAQQKKKPIIYTRWYWKYLMILIKAIPEELFKRSSL